MSDTAAGLRRGKQTEARRCTEVVRDLLGGFKNRFEERIRDTGITLPQMRMLKAVAQQSEEGESSAAAIARRCHVTPQTLQAMLARATREGWIVRGTSTRNNRIVTASLTPRGREILALGMQIATEIEAEVWHGVPLAEMVSMRRTLEAALANLDGN